MNYNLQWIKKVFGIDIQNGHPVIVCAKRVGSSVNYSNITVAEFHALRETDKTSAVSVSLSAKESIVRWLEAPFASVSKATKVFPTLLDIQLPFPLDDCISLFLDTRKTSEDKVRTLSAVARKKDVEQKIESLATMNIDPTILDQEGLALWTQSLRESPTKEDPDSFRVVVYISTERTVLSVGRGINFISAHAAQTNNTDQLHRLIKAALSNEQDQETEITLFWTGPEAKDADRIAIIEKSLADRLRIKFNKHNSPESFLARALAARVLIEGTLRCNLRSGAYTHPDLIRHNRRRTKQTSIILLVSGLILCCANLTSSWITHAKQKKIETQLAELTDKLMGYHIDAKGEQAINSVKAQVQEDKKTLRPFLDTLSPSLTITLHALLDVAKKYDIRYEMISLSRDSVSIDATAFDLNHTAAINNLLKSKGYTFKTIMSEAGSDERVPFSIRPGESHE